MYWFLHVSLRSSEINALDCLFSQQQKHGFDSAVQQQQQQQ